MKNLFKKKETVLDFSNVGLLLTSGAAAGVAIAKFAGKQENIGGIIGAGVSLLVTGLILAMDDDISEEPLEND